MAKATGKNHAQVNLDIWGNDDWLDLTPPAQHLYLVLWTSPELSYCGCGPWHPGRIAAKARGWTSAAVEAAAVELSAELFLIVDTATEEFDLRSWIKHDGLWKSPTMAVSMANARAALASRILRGVVVHEVTRIKARNIAEATEDDPVSKSWQREAVKNLLSNKAIDPATLPRFTPTFTPSLTHALTHGLTPQFTDIGGVGVDPSAHPSPTPTPTPAPISSSILQRGYVTGERHQGGGPKSKTPYPNRCLAHTYDPKPGKCGDCADARRADKALTEALKDAAAAVLRDCTDCDDDGWRHDDHAVKCTH